MRNSGSCFAGIPKLMPFTSHLNSPRGWIVTTCAREPVHRVRVLQNSREFGKQLVPTARFLQPEFGNECDYNLVRHNY